MLMLLQMKVEFQLYFSFGLFRHLKMTFILVKNEGQIQSFDSISGVYVARGEKVLFVSRCGGSDAVILRRPPSVSSLSTTANACWSSPPTRCRAACCRFSPESNEDNYWSGQNQEGSVQIKPDSGQSCFFSSPHNMNIENAFRCEEIQQMCKSSGWKWSERKAENKSMSVRCSTESMTFLSLLTDLIAVHVVLRPWGCSRLHPRVSQAACWVKSLETWARMSGCCRLLKCIVIKCDVT